MNQPGHQPEWLDLRAATEYACVSERTMRTWIGLAVNPLPAFRVGGKILISRSEFDRWLRTHPVTTLDVDAIVEDLAGGLAI